MPHNLEREVWIKSLFAGIAAAAVVTALFEGLHAHGPYAVFGATLVVAIGASLGSRLAGRALGFRLKELRVVVRRWREGERGSQEGDPRDDEVGALASSLTELGRNLQRTLTELRSEQQLSLRILDGMQEGVLLLDAQNHVLRVNPALREMLLTRADVEGKPLIEVVRHAELHRLTERAARGIAESTEIELAGIKPTRLLVRAVVLTAGQGTLLVFVDVTEMRKLESMRRDFVANVSHELRTPVTSVLSGAETLRAALRKSPEAALSFVDLIERNAARLHALVEDLLDLSRIEANELHLRVERIRLAPLGEQTIALFRERAAAKNMQLACRASHEGHLFTDRRAVEQIASNLVDNAVKYGRPSGKIELVFTREGASTKLEVKDDGPGIPSQHLPRLFERFYRIDGGRARDQGGTGLGLAIVKHLAEALSGSVEVTSAVPSGTTFTVRLPDLDASTSTPPRDKGPERAREPRPVVID